MSREAAYVALFNQLAPLNGNPFVSFSRNLQYLEDMDAAKLPALFMTVHDQDVQPAENMPARRTYAALVYIYAYNPDPNVAAGTQLNNLIDAVEAALATPDDGQDQTLGGAVYWAKIKGRIAIYEGPDNEKAAACIPVYMLAP